MTIAIITSYVATPRITSKYIASQLCCLGYNSPLGWDSLLRSSYLVHNFTLKIVKIVTPCSTGIDLLSRCLVGQCNLENIRTISYSNVTKLQLLKMYFILHGLIVNSVMEMIIQNVQLNILSIFYVAIAIYYISNACPKQNQFHDSYRSVLTDQNSMR